MLNRTQVDLSQQSLEDLESQLGSRLLSDPMLRSLVEELCHRQLDKEHHRLESGIGDQLIESQGIIRGTLYFMGISEKEKQKREGLDRS